MITALEGDEESASRPGRSLPPGKDLVAIVREAGWAPGPVWTGAENLATTGIRSPDCRARSQSLYRLCYPAHIDYTRYNQYCDTVAKSTTEEVGNVSQNELQSMISNMKPLLTH